MRITRVTLSVMALVLGTSCGGETLTAADGASTDTAAQADAVAAPDVVEGPGTFVYATTCSLPAEPPANTDVTLVEAFPNLTPGSINYPLLLTHGNDGSGRLYVVERFGKIKVFDNDPEVTTATTVLDLSNAIATNSEGGLLGLAFHPDYATNGHLFVNYTVLVGDTMHSLVSRFTVSPPSGNEANPFSEVVILDIAQPYYNHDGGMIAFGPDGHLYVGMGDGGAGGDPLGHGQNTNTLLGAMLRIDVDTPSGGLNYGIPPDNPFVGGGGRPEIYAWGLRNPWRFSFDTATGALWAGDVGQNHWEEIAIVGLGENHGWNTVEGFACFPPEVTSCDKTGMTPPVMVYPNGGKGSVTGGYVYRGDRVPSLYGTYIFADYEHYTLYLMPTDESPPTEPAMTTPGRVAGFGQDAEGEVYVLDLLEGTIYRFEPADAPTPITPSAPFPQTLSQTGCFADLTTMTPAAGVLPYELNLPFWSDGAEKSRWMVLPEGGQIDFATAGEWTVPDGTLFIKHFELDEVGGRTRLETRLLVHEPGGVRGYVYRWNDAGTEATLLQSGDTRAVTVTEDGAPVTFDWQFPARHQCRSCHTSGAGGVLGIETAQLHRDTALHGPLESQLARWADWGIFTEDTAPTNVASLSGHPGLDDAGATLDARTRSWLHVNCASCHMGGAEASEMDLRVGTSLANTVTCDATPNKGDLGMVGAKLVTPGDPGRSVLYQRVVSHPPYRMPPLATSRLDREGAGLLEAWITGLQSCP